VFPAVDQLLADEHVDSLGTAGDVVWPLTDNLNTVRDLATYDSGADTTTIANHRVFDAYGNLKSQTNAAVDCLFGYTGRQFDQDTGLQNNLNRWYDAKVGRWASEDPIGFGAGDANMARYVSNSPMTVIDPSGLVKVILVPGTGPGKGGTYDYKFKFMLDRPAPSDGYIVQKITETRSGQTDTFWEAWRVRKGELEPGINNRDGYTDNWWDDVGGADEITTGEIKFFPEEKTGVLGDPFADDPIFTDPTTGFGPFQQSDMSGSVPSTTVEPPWWNDPSANGERTGHSRLEIGGNASRGECGQDGYSLMGVTSR
jgi:RHS repeat-associated protein